MKYEQRRDEHNKKIIQDLENNRTSIHKYFILCSKTGLLFFAPDANKSRSEEVKYKIIIPKISPEYKSGLWLMKDAQLVDWHVFQKQS